MPSTLIELMLRSPDSSNLAKASLREGQGTGRLSGRPPAPGAVPSFVCRWLEISDGPVPGHRLTRAPNSSADSRLLGLRL